MTQHGRQIAEEERARVQDRLALLWRSIFSVALIGFLVHLYTVFGHTNGIHRALIIANPLLPAAAWWWCRARRHSMRTLATIELGGLFASVLCVCVLVRMMMPGILWKLGVDPRDVSQFNTIAMVQTFLFLSTVLGLTLRVVMRAAIVPSSPRRTLLVTAALGLPALAVSMFGLPFEPLAAYQDRMGGNSMLYTLTTGLSWWGIVTFACVLTTRVVHGLRREARAARALGQYLLEAQIGEGGMGVVYRATHGLMRRPTAVKLLSPDKAGVQNIERFEREARLTARLTHPNTVTIYDYGRTPDGLFYYAMELLDGADLAALVERTGPLSTPRALAVLVDVAQALEEAHGIGLIHRDVKPGNIMLCTQGGRTDVVKLVDFGLVKELQYAAHDARLPNDSGIVGTPRYLAPEAISTPAAVDARSDVYALGAVGYYLLTGTHVFGGGTLAEVIKHHLYSRPPPMSERLQTPVPTDIEAVILACLSKSPADRPHSAAECAARLMRCAAYGSWTQSDAREWWAEHADELASDAAAPGSDEPERTMTIERRYGAALA